MKFKQLILGAALLLFALMLAPSKADAAPFVTFDAFGRAVILDDGSPCHGGGFGASGFSSFSTFSSGPRFRGGSFNSFNGFNGFNAGRIEATTIRGPLGRVRFQQFRSGF